MGLLRCGDTMVFYALKESLHKDPDDRVKYEAAKSLILIGELWFDIWYVGALNWKIISQVMCINKLLVLNIVKR